MPAYYNEHDPYCVEWLKNLIAANLIAPGDVDGRDIQDVKADDLKGYTQCHFFAGIGGWSAALRIASWDDDRPVWTGSCPCQPFSQAGHRKGFDDDRHLWPAWRDLIRQRRPAIVFGEQVASPDGIAWFGQVQTDLEGDSYAAAAGDLATAGIGAPVQGHRLYFVATSDCDRFSRNAEPHEWAEARQQAPRRHDPYRCCADAFVTGEFVVGNDGALRNIEPGIESLVDGLSALLAQLRAYGNAINPSIAAEFIIAASEAMIELDHSPSGESPRSKLGGP